MRRRVLLFLQRMPERHPSGYPIFPKSDETVVHTMRNINVRKWRMWPEEVLTYGDLLGFLIKRCGSGYPIFLMFLTFRTVNAPFLLHFPFGF